MELNLNVMMLLSIKREGKYTHTKEGQSKGDYMVITNVEQLNGTTIQTTTTGIAIKPRKAMRLLISLYSPAVSNYKNKKVK